MTTRRLLYALLRHTATLIACLATRPGERTALADLTDQMRWSLLEALRQRDLGPKVIADMFGVAPTTYHAWLRRGEVDTQGTTLWGEVLLFIRQNGVVDRATLENAFRHEDPVQLRGIVNDLVESGLLFRTGARRRTRYRAAGDDELGPLDSPEATALLVWVVVFQSSREHPVDAPWLTAHLGLAAEDVDRALRSLTDSGHIVEVVDADGAPRYSCAEYRIGFGDAAGWQAAILDHYRAMVDTVCARLCGDAGAPTPDARTGGSTYVFDLHDTHPLRDEVLRVLSRYRDELGGLRSEVDAHNRREGLDPADADRVRIYIGQSIQGPISRSDEGEDS